MNSILKKVFYFIKRVPFLAKLSMKCFEMIDYFQYQYFDRKWKKQGLCLPDDKEVSLFREQITFIYKSFERQKLAIRLYRSIQKYYPGVKVIIADDSREPLQIKDAGEELTIIHLPFNSGLSFGLQKALDLVQTPYVIRMDDDQMLTRKTMFGRQLSFLKEYSEVALSSVLQFSSPKCAPLSRVLKEFVNDPMLDAPKPLSIPHGAMLDSTHVVFGKCSNVFVGRTDAIRAVGYDTNVRMLDHRFFFWRAAGRIVSVIDTECLVWHSHFGMDNNYQQYREDIDNDRRYIQVYCYMMQNVIKPQEETDAENQ